MCKVKGIMGSGDQDLKETRVLNRVIRWGPKGVYYEADPRQAEQLIKDLGVEYEKPASTPGNKKSEMHYGAQEGEAETLDAENTTLYRACAARANYLSQDRPDIAFAAKECCRRMSAPTVMDMKALRRIAAHLIGRPRLVYSYEWQRSEDAKLCIYADTDFAGCLATRRSTTSGCAMVGSCLVKHWSST